MKGILKLIGGVFVALFKKITGSSDAVIVQLPDNISISREMLDHCLTIVNNIKSVVNNPVTVLLTDIIPGSIDNLIRQKISDTLPVILAGLTFSKHFLDTEDKNVLIDDLLNKIHFADDPDKDALYHSLAARLIVVASDGKVTWSEAAQLVEIYFKQFFTNK